MIDKFKNIAIQDISLANALNIKDSEIKRLNLFQMKNQMFNKAFKMRDNNITISQGEANKLNRELKEIIDTLEKEYDYDAMQDYIVDFDSFVESNSYYNTFCW